LGLSLDDLARRFDRSMSWVSRRLALVRELPESVQQSVRLGKVGAHAAMKYLVPIARANRRSCERLAEEIARNQFSTREVGQIYEAWRKGPIYVQNSIIDDPKLFLRARREIEDEDPEGVRAGEELLRSLDMAGAIARRAARQWHEAAATMNHAEREHAWLCVQQALEDLTRLSDKMQKENDYVESESAHGNLGASPQGRGQSPDCACPQNLAFSGQESNPLRVDHPAADRPSGEGGAVSAGNPGSVCLLPREPGPSP
jgi:hypothetical protein